MMIAQGAALTIVLLLFVVYNQSNLPMQQDPWRTSQLSQKAFEDSVIRSLGQIKRQLQFVHDTLVEEKCARTKVLATGGFCLSEERILVGGNYAWDAEVCKGIEELVGNVSVGDFGAGLGLYGRCFLRIKDSPLQHKNELEKKILQGTYIESMTKAGLIKRPQVIYSYEAFDGALNIELLSKGVIQNVDLTEEVDLGYKFSWVMSLEVGEHIPRRYEGVFLNNLVRHACKGVVLSWAVPGQGGHHHVNEQPNTYIQDQMDHLGFRYDNKASQRLRKLATLSWLKDTLMVFWRKEPLAC